MALVLADPSSLYRRELFDVRLSTGGPPQYSSRKIARSPTLDFFQLCCLQAYILAFAFEEYQIDTEKCNYHFMNNYLLYHLLDMV